MKTIRQTEAGELAALRRDYDARLDQAATNYAKVTGRIQDVFDNRNAALTRQITHLRKQKSESRSGPPQSDDPGRDRSAGPT